MARIQTNLCRPASMLPFDFVQAGALSPTSLADHPLNCCVCVQEKLALKEEKEASEVNYKTAYVDGRPEPVSQGWPCSLNVILLQEGMQQNATKCNQYDAKRKDLKGDLLFCYQGSLREQDIALVV